MSQTGLRNIDSSMQKTNEWLHEICDELHIDDRQAAYHVLRGTLHALRDNLNTGANANFASQLPLIVRGIYFEGWTPADERFKDGPKSLSLDAFLERIEQDLMTQQIQDPQRAAKAVFGVIKRHMTQSQVQKLKDQLKADVKVMLD